MPIKRLTRMIFKANPQSLADKVTTKLEKIKMARRTSSKKISQERHKHALLAKAPGKAGKRTITIRAMKRSLQAAQRL